MASDVMYRRILAHDTHERTKENRTGESAAILGRSKGAGNLSCLLWSTAQWVSDAADLFWKQKWKLVSLQQL